MINTIKLTEKSAAFSISNKRMDNTITIDGVEMVAHIQSLKYDKEVYHPCHVEADIVLLSKLKKLPSVAELRSYFLSKDLSLTLTEVSSEVVKGNTENEEENTATIGENYRIMGVVPRMTRAGGKSVCYVHLTIYSKDYLLTLEKYCRAYTGQKLGEHIFKNKMEKFDASLYSYSTTGLKLIKYKPDADKGWVEFRQPYLVQYNESFYDFLARHCNRCGEFLFFEGGKLTMGLPENTAKTHASKAGTLGMPKDPYPYFVIDPDLVMAVSFPVLSDTEKFVTGKYYDYMQSKAADSKYNEGREADAYDWDMAGDEYFDELDMSGPDSFAKEIAIAPKFMAIISNLPMSMTKARAWGESITRMLTEIGMLLGKDELSAVYCNHDFNKNVEENASKNTEFYSKDEQVQDGNIHQFATLPPKTAVNVAGDKYKNLSSLFFQFVGLKQYEASQSAIELELLLVPEVAQLRVGERIQYENQTYVIIRVSGSFMQNNGEVEESLTILAIPYTDENIIVPPAYKLIEPPRASAQPAFVADSEDPRYMGRVRLRFPWQEKDAIPSPWVRMATPMASSPGGFFARPEKDDEVLVEFRNGNMNHPVVVGALYRNDRPTPHIFKYAYSVDSTMKWMNNNGQSIILRNGHPKDFILSFFPSIGNCLSWAPVSPINKFFDEVFGVLPDSVTSTFNKLAGGVTITDSFGLTSITTDTPSRSVTIKSVLGNVTLSALTGITISAPYGDISIAGKNVSIKALNNISLESGVAIKNEIRKFDFEKKLSSLGVLASVGGAASGILSAVVDKLNKPVDMTLIRCLWEIYLGPKEGTLLLKSNRYLQLEAGKGKTSDTNTGFISYLTADASMEVTAALRLVGKRVKSEIRTAAFTKNKVAEKCIQIDALIEKAKKYGIKTSYANASEIVTALYGGGKYKTEFKRGSKTYSDCSKFKKDKSLNVRRAFNYLYYENIDAIMAKYEECLHELKHLVHTMPLCKVPLKRRANIYPSTNENFLKLSQNTGYVPASVRSKYRETLKGVLKDAFTELVVLPDANGFAYKKEVVAQDMDRVIEKFTRKAYYLFLKEVDFIKVDRTVTADDIADNSKWQQYVDSIEMDPKSPSVVEMLTLGEKASAFVKNFKFWSHNNEASRWTPEQTGRIMMSDDPRSTLMLSNDGVLERKDNGMAALKAHLKANPQHNDNEMPADVEGNNENNENQGN